jgi:hypothetical protein
MDLLPEPNFPVRPSEFVGRRSEIDEFREALRHGLAAGRTSSFAILGEWGIGKSSLLGKFADMCSEPTFSMLPAFAVALHHPQGGLHYPFPLIHPLTHSPYPLSFIHSNPLSLGVQNGEWN